MLRPVVHAKAEGVVPDANNRNDRLCEWDSDKGKEVQKSKSGGRFRVPFVLLMHMIFPPTHVKDE